MTDTFANIHTSGLDEVSDDGIMVAGIRRFVLQHFELAYGLVGGDEDVVND